MSKNGIENELRNLKHDRFIVNGDNFTLERRHNTITVRAEGSLKTKSFNVEGKITPIGWIVALILAPAGTVYYFLQKGSRVKQLTEDIQDVFGTR